MTKFIKVNISDIKVESRKRNISDLTNLIESIKNNGLINPITINKDMTLIAELHRLEVIYIFPVRAAHLGGPFSVY